MSFDTLLIANRGEIALRVMRSAKAMGLRVIAVHVAAEANAPHARAADAAVEIPSYLDGASLIAAAQASGAGAVHPGYGFLAENAEFAEACAEAGLVFIGPSPEAIALMGEKGAAKRAAVAAGVPCLPGYDGTAQDDATLIAEGARIGVPLMVKPALGGGGKGMRLVTDLADLPEALSRARSEAQNAFGDATLILERALIAPRHIEVQVFGDQHGNAVHMYERDCSVQRRHQKVIEEAPSPAVTPELRAEMGAASVSLVQSSGYSGAGTVEFLFDGKDFWFLEMNARLQVEHPVTEAITGLDLVEWQIRVARGEPLPLAQDQIPLMGHAIEARLYAEDPAQGFLPQAGRVLNWQAPAGLRCDHALETGQEISGGFDPMLAKLIAHGPDRETAHRRLIAGLEATVLQGVQGNRRFLAAVLAHPQFAQGSATTDFLDGSFAGDPSLTPQPPTPAQLAAAVLINAGAPFTRFGFTNGPPPRLTRRFEAGEAQHSVTLTLHPESAAQLADGPRVVLLSRSEAHARISIDGMAQSLAIARDGTTLWLDDLALRDVTLAPSQAAEGAGDGRVTAPMAGGVVSVAATVGARVAQGQILAVLEAMKMEHPLRAPCAGVIRQASITAGAQVRAKQLLFQIEPEDI
ncbi:acetyl/propionyl/methylcrotonyl-CoA carboxylase subunit alpha [Pararhodobacter oceanensis]|uniref:acetyl/propionyl/methylcrotonyl-CoA carboxylase subunit alpha n=1 Tax=Pararhodobacter oceanensis TaxID=2172121 RepID=UPI003A8E8C0B